MFIACLIADIIIHGAPSELCCAPHGFCHLYMQNSTALKLNTPFAGAIRFHFRLQILQQIDIVVNTIILQELCGLPMWP